MQEEPDVHSRHLSIAKLQLRAVPRRLVRMPSRVSAEPSRAVPSQCRAEPCEDYFAHQVRWQE